MLQYHPNRFFLGMAMGQSGAEGWGFRSYLAWFCLTYPRLVQREKISYPISAS